MKYSCEDVQERTAEMALGISTEDERRQILKHIRGCESCSEAVREMSQISSRILLSAPSADPPAGFEQRVLDEIRSHEPPRLMRVRWAALAAAAALLMGILWTWLLPRMFVSEQDRLTTEYIQALETLGGKALYAGRLESTAGEDVGAVFVYEGSPSWMFLTVEDDKGLSGEFHVRLGLAGGESHRFEGLTLVNGKGSLGVRLDLPVKQIRQIEIVDQSDQITYLIKRER